MVAIVSLVFGVAFIRKRKELTESALLSQESFWKVFGVQQSYTRLTKIIAESLIVFLGLAFVAVALIAIYAFLTGQKFPLQWHDLWPF